MNKKDKSLIVITISIVILLASIYYFIILGVEPTPENMAVSYFILGTLTGINMRVFE